MSTAKKLFESRMELLMAANDRDTADKDSVYIDYIFELKQDLKDSELRRADLLKSLRNANEQKAELEAEKSELVDNIKKIKSLCKSKAVNNHLDQIFIISDIILNKHTEEGK